MTGEVKRYDIYGGILCPDGIGPIMYHADHLAVVEGLRAEVRRYRYVITRGQLPTKTVDGYHYGDFNFWPTPEAAIDEAMRGGGDP